jgi:hypothetical protein
MREINWDCNDGFDRRMLARQTRVCQDFGKE